MEGVTDAKSLIRHLKKIKTNGYAIQTTVNRIVGIALPISKNEKVIAALSLYMPTLRFKELKKADIIKKDEKGNRRQ